MRNVFGDRHFRKLFFSNLFSGFGQGMTMIGISWYLVESTGTVGVLGSTMLISAILSLLIAPYVGTLIDRYSRKLMLQIEQLGGFAILFFLAAWGLWAPYEEWMLVLLYLATMFMFQLHEPAQAAFVQEIFEQKQYKAVNAALEVENQTALVLAGACAGLLLGQFGLHVVLLLNAFTYFLAFVTLSGIDYAYTPKRQAESAARTSWWVLFSQSWVYIRKKPGFLIFGVSALMPFIAVLLTNLLNPLFVSQVLREGVNIYSFGEVTYSIGAVAAGMWMGWLSQRFGAIAYMVFHFIWMAIALVMTVAMPIGWVFVLLSAFLGWCNVSTRLIRQNLYMELLPNHLMGRVLSFFRAIGTLMRLLLLALFTFMLDSTNAAAGYLVLAVLVMIAAAGIAVSMPTLLRQTAPRDTTSP